MVGTWGPWNVQWLLFSLETLFVSLPPSAVVPPLRLPVWAGTSLLSCSPLAIDVLTPDGGWQCLPVSPDPAFWLLVLAFQTQDASPS